MLGDKQKKQLGELKIQQATKEDDIPNPPPQPPTQDPPFQDLEPAQLDPSGEPAVISLASFDHWMAVVNDARTQCSRMVDSLQPLITEVDDWDHHDFSIIEKSCSSADGRSAAIDPSLCDISSKDGSFDNLAGAPTAEPFIRRAVSASTISSDISSQSPSISWPLTRIQSPSDPTIISPQDSSLIQSAIPTQTLHFTYVSIHIACSANALALGCTAEKCVRTGYNSPFNQPSIGPALPPHLADRMNSSDALWLSQGKASGWKNLKKYLRPTPAQLTRPHNLWMDTLPFPTLRERFLLLMHDLNGQELASDIAFNDGIICWAPADSNSSETSSIAVNTGAPWDIRNWEVKPWFVRKWWRTGVLGDEDDEIWEQCVWWAQWRKSQGTTVSGEDYDLTGLWSG